MMDASHRGHDGILIDRAIFRVCVVYTVYGQMAISSGILSGLLFYYR